MKVFNTLMKYHTLHRERKHFCCYCLHAFSTEEILKRDIKDLFKINYNAEIMKKNKVTVYDLCRF